MNSAVYSLAMREHSRQEIHNKLKRKDFSADVDLEALLDELERQNYLSDARYAESYISSRSSKGYGFLKIRQELQQRGVSSQLIYEAQEKLEIDWFALAQQQRQKKYGDSKPANFKEKAKQMRFLSGRGFSHEEIQHSFG